MSDIAIKIINIKKRFKLYNNVITGPVKEFLFFWNNKKYYEEFWAVNDVSMEIKKGEVIGIIGPNGAGKTTILKMIAGLLPINYGKIEINGKVTALLALGVGINPEFTGRENIFYSGMLLGMTKEEIIRKTPAIIEFAELGEFIDKPIRTYSSGMRARLLFSTSMSIDPDILIVDEALSTGDIYFIQKSSEKIKDFCNSGATIIFVSHNLQQIKRLCSRVILIIKGEVKFDGCPNDAITEYGKYLFKSKTNISTSSKQENIFKNLGTGVVDMLDIKIYDNNKIERNVFYQGEKINIKIKFISKKKIKEPIFCVEFHKKNIQVQYYSFIETKRYFNSEDMSFKKFHIKEIYNIGEIEFLIEKNTLGVGKYHLNFDVYDEDTASSYSSFYSYYENIKTFSIIDNVNYIGRTTLSEIACKMRLNES